MPWCLPCMFPRSGRSEGCFGVHISSHAHRRPQPLFASFLSKFSVDPVRASPMHTTKRSLEKGTGTGVQLGKGTTILERKEEGVRGMPHCLLLHVLAHGMGRGSKPESTVGKTGPEYGVTCTMHMFCMAMGPSFKIAAATADVGIHWTAAWSHPVRPVWSTCRYVCNRCNELRLLMLGAEPRLCLLSADWPTECCRLEVNVQVQLYLPSVVAHVSLPLRKGPQVNTPLAAARLTDPRCFCRGAHI